MAKAKTQPRGNARRTVSSGNEFVSQPWAWILLALNPLFIVNGVHTIDFYIKAIWIAAVLAVTFLFTRAKQKERTPLSFNIMELFWIGYMVWGCLGLLWAASPVLTYERLVYLGYPMGAYIVGKQTYFWRSTLFWNVFAGVALVVGIIGMCMWLFSGSALGFDWIMSAGRPSSTLSYRAYAGTYLVMSLPFLLWFMFSKHIKSPGHFLFAASAFSATFVFLIYIRARSGWLGFVMSFLAMAVICLAQGRWRQVRYLPYTIATVLVTIVLSILPPSSYLLKGDTNPQKLEGTDKVSLGGAFGTIEKVVRSGQSDRIQFWQISRRMLFEKSIRGKYEGPMGQPFWMLGVGQNQWPIYVPLYSDILHSLGAEVHNDWIQAFVEGGPIGFFFNISFMLSLLFYAWRARHKGLMVACIGAIFAWVFATQTDFLTARIYGVLWIGGIAAMIWGEADVNPVLTLQSIRWSAIPRKVAGVFFIYLAIGYAVTMWCDRQIYRALVHGSPAVDALVDPTSPSSIFPTYNYGIGKYLIFSPITDLSRAIANMDAKKADPAILRTVQKKIAQEVLVMHPFNHNAMALLTDINFKQNDYKESLKYNEQYLEIRPKDHNMWLFKSQTLLALGDSTKAAQAAYEAVKLAPEVLNVQQFWQTRFTAQYRDAVVKQVPQASKP